MISKILILSSGRSGSSSLIWGLAKGIKNSISHFEPFSPRWSEFVGENQEKTNTHIQKILEQSKTNIVIEKNIVTQPFYMDKTKRLRFWGEYLTNFDRVILLSRRNFEATAESYAHSKVTDKWFKTYNSKDIKSIDKKEIDNMLEEVKESNSIINSLSKYYKLPIIYYEDLFSKNRHFQENFLKIYNLDSLDYPDKFYEVLNPKNKYRK